VLFENKGHTTKPVYTEIGHQTIWYRLYVLPNFNTNTWQQHTSLLLLFVVNGYNDFFFKNLFNYLASHHIMHLKEWR
jgi:subfamily B ATP-binding cassette protein MsbA